MLLCVMRSGKAEEKERSEETSVTVRFWQLLYTCFFFFCLSLCRSQPFTLHPGFNGIRSFSFYPSPSLFRPFYFSL